MAHFATLEQLKRRTFTDDTDYYDARLQDILDEAEETVIRMTDFPAADVRSIPADCAEVLPLRLAILRLAEVLHAAPDADTQMIHQLVRPFERLCGGSPLAALIAKYKTEDDSQIED